MRGHYSYYSTIYCVYIPVTNIELLPAFVCPETSNATAPLSINVNSLLQRLIVVVVFLTPTQVVIRLNAYFHESTNLILNTLNTFFSGTIAILNYSLGINP